ncbi:nucleoside-diphosphate kinase [Fructilactobacillus vespulae]|uniref:nucleoside-diphosphate kinase n=1 Tax=Fructilactobacillus vespulae TaxID=1249630 RepID=UPI0039B6E979
MNSERILILIKPDGVNLGHIGEVITRIELKGYEIESLKVTHATKDQLHKHYANLVDKPFYPDIESYMTEGPIVAIIATGTKIVNVFHRMAGDTDPSKAAFGTIRGDLGREWSDGLLRNVVHSSDSVESAEKEIKIWFPEK